MPDQDQTTPIRSVDDSHTVARQNPAGESNASPLCHEVGPTFPVEDDCHALCTEMPIGCALFEVVTDEAGQVADLRFLEANRAFELATAGRRPIAAGMSVTEILPSASLETMETLSRVALSGLPCAFDNYVLEYDRWYEMRAFRPRVGRVAVLFQDITQRKSDELMLR
ncbi:MAG TPA: PAS domain-containing protein, partial [Chloroflexota bacterium]|nr:PAS domain-containing protein [Chloroflexota bacterium]